MTRPSCCSTRNGTFSLASSTTRATSPVTNVVTVTRGMATLPTSSTLEAARHSTFASSKGASRRAIESTGTSQCPASNTTGAESRRRSPCTEARLRLL